MSRQPCAKMCHVQNFMVNTSLQLRLEQNQISIEFELRWKNCLWNGPQDRAMPWASYQIRKIAGCACAGNAGNVFPCRRFQGNPLVSDPGMHHGTCVTHVPWCMSGSLTWGDGENVPGIHGACAPAILRIWQEAHTKHRFPYHKHRCNSDHEITKSYQVISTDRNVKKTKWWQNKLTLFLWNFYLPVFVLW